MSSYSSPTDVVALSRAKSADINNLDSAVETAFGLLPSEDDLTRGTTCYAVDTGAADAYLVDLTHEPSGYVDGLEVCFRPLNVNTGAATINVNSLGVKSIKLSGNVDPAAGDIPADTACLMRYSISTGCFHILSSTAQSTVAITQAEVTAARDGESTLLAKQQAQDTEIADNASDIGAIIHATYPTEISAMIEFRGFGYGIMLR